METGVAHGVTSRVILEALERLGSGHPWSIDLPAMDSALHDSIGIAVPGSLTSLAEAQAAYVAPAEDGNALFGIALKGG